MPGVSFKTRFYFTFVIVLVFGGLGYALLVDTSPPDPNRNRRQEAVVILVTWTPHLKVSDGPGVQIYLRTDPGAELEGPLGREDRSSPYKRIVTLYEGQKVTVTASRLVIETLGCAIMRGKDRVASNGVVGGGKTTCTYVGAPT